MSFSIRGKNDTTFIFENSSTSSGTGGGLPLATIYGQYTFYDASAGRWVTGGNPLKIGANAGQFNQSSNTVAIGSNAANTQQGSNSVAIGGQAGQVNQGDNAVAIGFGAGYTGQGSNSVAIGANAGYTGQGSNSVAIGIWAGQTNQASEAIAIGSNSGGLNQASGAIAIGFQTAVIGQKANSIAIGRVAGFTNQGSNCIAIGGGAGYTNQPDNCIVINALGTSVPLNGSTANAFFVQPIRADVSGGNRPLVYNTTTKEIIVSTDKTFVIPHPIDSNKYLVHGCLEGPESGVYYRGEGEITNGEYVDITLPEYTSTFTNFTVNVSPVTHTLFSASRVSNGSFRVKGENGSFHWLVHATRKEINVEPLISEVKLNGQGPYKWIE